MRRSIAYGKGFRAMLFITRRFKIDAPDWPGAAWKSTSDLYLLIVM
jgi:hypothetical protein